MNSPERYYNVSQTQLSVARHFGGCKVNGQHYAYDPTTDTLTRYDVLKREAKERTAAVRAKRKADRDAAHAAQLDALRAEMTRDEEPLV